MLNQISPLTFQNIPQCIGKIVTGPSLVQLQQTLPQTARVVGHAHTAPSRPLRGVRVGFHLVEEIVETFTVVLAFGAGDLASGGWGRVVSS